jgi:hypothetical protein
MLVILQTFTLLLAVLMWCVIKEKAKLIRDMQADIHVLQMVVFGSIIPIMNQNIDSLCMDEKLLQLWLGELIKLNKLQEPYNLTLSPKSKTQKR